MTAIKIIVHDIKCIYVYIYTLSEQNTTVITENNLFKNLLAFIYVCYGEHEFIVTNINL